LYSSADIFRQIRSRRRRWVGHMPSLGKERKVCKVLVGKPKGKRPVERPRCRWEEGNKMDLRETGWWGVGWIHLAEARDRRRAFVNTAMNLRVLVPRDWLVKRS
jgi:hypothetical protein